MIHSVTSTLDSFKSVEFRDGLNIFLAKKEKDSTELQTRNRAGKSSLIEIIHFLLGSSVKADSIFLENELVNKSFAMRFEYNSTIYTINRSGHEKDKLFLVKPIGAVEVVQAPLVEDGTQDIVLTEERTVSDWTNLLGSWLFKLDIPENYKSKKPSFRSLILYFIRRALDGGFMTPEKAFIQQSTVDYQMNLMYLLGLDWRIASEWNELKGDEETLKSLKKALKGGKLKSLVGRSSELRTQLVSEETILHKMQLEVKKFKVLPQYNEFETEANRLTRRLNELSNLNSIDLSRLKDLEEAILAETPPPVENLAEVYKDAGVSLPDLVTKRYEDVYIFHESVIRNRKNYLQQELDRLRESVKNRNDEMQTLDQRKSDIMQILNTHQALDQLNLLNEQINKQAGKVAVVRDRYESALRVETLESSLKIEREQLTLRLSQNLKDQEKTVMKVIAIYEEFSNCLLTSAGKLEIDKGDSGPIFKFEVQGKKSVGITKMQIFCFDLTLMRICTESGIGPRFLIHDSHLFDGVDGRQIMQALQIAAKTARELNFQYIVTMNEDDAFKERILNFNPEEYVLTTVVTDATEDGGLFGMRFG